MNENCKNDPELIFGSGTIVREGTNLKIEFDDIDQD